MVKLKCRNKKCGYSWDYNGKNDFWATCSRCKSSVKVRRSYKRRRTSSRGIRRNK